jgi:hypothetical protein
MDLIRVTWAWVGMAVFLGTSPVMSQVRQTGGTQEARLSGACQSVDEPDISPLTLGDVRVRRGGQAIVSGIRQSVFIDAGGQADIRATGALVYVARGGQATVGGQRNQVYAEQGSKVVLVGQVLLTIVDTIDLHVHRNASSCQ